MLGKSKGQSVLEYAMIIAVVVAALIAIQLYMKKGVEGRLRASSDQIGDHFDPADFTNEWKNIGGQKSGGIGSTVTIEARTPGTKDGSITSIVGPRGSSEVIERQENDTWKE